MQPAPDHDAGADAAGRQQAARLRQQFRGWIVVWLARDRQFRAYRRLPGARRDTTLSAGTATGIAAQITRAEHATHGTSHA
jgi:hypothetical protein